MFTTLATPHWHLTWKISVHQHCPKAEKCSCSIPVHVTTSLDRYDVCGAEAGKWQSTKNTCQFWYVGRFGSFLLLVNNWNRRRSDVLTRRELDVAVFYKIRWSFGLGSGLTHGSEAAYLGWMQEVKQQTWWVWSSYITNNVLNLLLLVRSNC